MTAAELRLQLELAVDIEDWDKVKQLRSRLERFDHGRGGGAGSGGCGGGGGCGHQAQSWQQPQRGGRSRSPRRGGRRHEQQAVEQWYHQVQAQPTENPVVIEYNKSIKHHLQKGSIEAARHVLVEMQYTGVRPTSVTYNEFLNFYAKCKDVGEALRVVAEMRRQGLQPNRVSASTILKALGERPVREHVEEVVNILNWVSQSEGVDEILLSSVAEATVRMGQHASKLYAVLRRELDEHAGAVWSAQTCGSLIRAHGHTKDVDGMWKMWNNMMGHRIRPTVVTTGCMVEQLVLNGHVNPAHDLVRSLESGGFSECVNSVVYYSLIKGYAMEREADKVWNIYRELRLRRLQTTVTTYNGIVGAFSECGLSDRANVLFAQMKSEGLTPTVCTWSRLAKGHCLRGDVKQAFEVMEQMRATSGLKPDEIFYNTLLDACAEQGLVDDGLKLLERMEQDHVAASKYTLSIMAKLLVRAGRVGDALHQVEQLSRRYRLEISTNIYTTLLGACSEFGDRLWAASMMRSLLTRNCRPDRRVFSGLMKRFMGLEPLADAVEAVRDLCLAVNHGRTLQGMLDRPALQEAIVARATSGGVEEARRLLDELQRATDGGFWFDLDGAVGKGRSVEPEGATSGAPRREEAEGAAGARDRAGSASRSASPSRSAGRASIRGRSRGTAPRRGA